MTQKFKIGLGMAVFIALLAGASFSYDLLSKQVIADNIATETDEADTDKQMSLDFTMTDVDGNDITLYDIIENGKPVVLNFWASWCPPCKSEMPEFDSVYKELGDEIQFIMLDLTDGQKETMDIGAAYIKEQGFSFPVYFDTQQQGAVAYGITSIPTTLFIDKDGYIIAGAKGAIDEETLRRGIDLIK